MLPLRYPTEKNIDLLRRIITASSEPGDIVLDCFAGSGTTLAAANALGRHWIGVDNSPEAIRAMLDRFAFGTDAMGDFVKERNKSHSENISLFDVVEDTPTARSISQPITDFAFLAQNKDLPKAVELFDEHFEKPRIKHTRVA